MQGKVAQLHQHCNTDCARSKRPTSAGTPVQLATGLGACLRSATRALRAALGAWALLGALGAAGGWGSVQAQPVAPAAQPSGGSGQLVEQRADGAWQPCGTLAPCTSERAVLFTLARAQELAEAYKELPKLKALSADQDTNIRLLTDRLQLRDEKEASMSREINALNASLQEAALAEIRALESEAHALRQLGRVRLRWFLFGAGSAVGVAVLGLVIALGVGS